jgi:acyl-CoA thioesterase-2
MTRGVSDDGDTDVPIEASWTLRPEEIAPDRFRTTGLPLPDARVFGGRMLAEALAAAAATAAHMLPHSIHAQFLRPGDTALPMIFDVERIKDGRSLASRGVRISQDGKLIFIALVSMTGPGEGLVHQAPMPAALHPDTLESHLEYRARMREKFPRLVAMLWAREHPIEYRLVEFPSDMADHAPRLSFWFRPRIALPDDPVSRAGFVAYASDRLLISAALVRHLAYAAHDTIAQASLDHALWIHNDWKPAEWLLYTTESPVASQLRGFARGAIYSQSGVLVASTAQEAMLALPARS